ncbi:hypothetical protein CAMRE0001_0984 [Campylobacter rectus RM3267]|uniref:Uncharacterized protein n=1 Tax=Campylobacter rectus RM3267 TaxID=553218 RepID=B9D2P6_CAMRE|nr:hypothetical protein CAMRE0001_0984 [Campylobacter rectus RM3267]
MKRGIVAKKIRYVKKNKLKFENRRKFLFQVAQTRLRTNLV